jgi:20S proteasome alpha/beta subunit
MLTLKALEDAGYRHHRNTLSQYSLFGMEKRIEDKFGTKYFIHIEVFGPTPHQDPTTYNFDPMVQFIDNDYFEVGKKPTINMTYLDDKDTTIEDIEEFFERAWEFLNCPYYERNE